MRTALILAGLLVSLVAQPQENIYRWVDKDGIVHYSDQPGSPDAVLVPYTGVGSGAGYDESPPLYTSEPTRETAPPPYRSLNIISPAPEQAFFGADVTVAVTVELDTALRDGDELMIFVDGTRVPNVVDMGATLTGLSRGTHFLRAAVMDPAGTVAITSPQITIHVRQTSVAQPPTGPLLRPPPAPPPPGQPRPGS